MSKKIGQLILAMVTSLVAGHSIAAGVVTVYVAPAGNDADGDGMAAKPCQ